MHSLSFFSLAISFTFLARAQDTDLSAVKAAFAEHRIAEDLGIVFNPLKLLNVYLPEDNGKTNIVKSGITLPLNSTVGPPYFALNPPPESNPPGPERFVIIAVDPDAPTPEEPTNAQIRHLLAGNMSYTKKQGSPFLVNATAAVSDYRRPAPPPSALGSPHRYIFLVYEQSEKFANQTLVTPSTPFNKWDVAEFAEAVGLGNPIAGSFFLVNAPKTG